MTDSVRTANATTPTRRARLQPRVLEPRVLLDAAAVETAVAVAADAMAEPISNVDTTALFEAPATTGRREAYVVDTSVAGYEGLLSAVPEGAELFLIDGNASGLEQLNVALDSVGGQFDAIHLISHGTGGALKLGSDTVTASNVGNFQAALQGLGTHITENGDLLLYGCDIAGNTEGTQLLSSLASLTGADVAASTDATGGPNGDGDLEAWAGIDGIQTDPWAAVAGLDSPLQLEGLYAGREDGDPFGVVSGANLGWATDSSRDTNGKDWIASSGLGEKQVFVWSMNGTTRENEQLLDVPTGATAEFGRSIAMDGDTLVVADRDGGSYGMLYVYTRNTSTNVWTLARSIDVSTASSINGRIGHTGLANVGNQWLAVSGTRIAVGAPTEGGNTGQVAWFATATNWTSGTIVSGTFNEPGGYSSDSEPYFGSSVAIAGNALFVGAAGADINGNDGTFGWGDQGWHGAVFAYTWTASAPTTGLSTTVIATLDEGDDGGDSTNTYMGGAVDAQWDGTNYTVVIGSAGADGNDGDIRLYRATSLLALDSAAVIKISGRTTATESDKFGLSVAISGSRIVVGAPDHTADADAAVFSYSLATYTQAGIVATETKWTPSGAYGGVAIDDLGRSVTITQAGVIAVGAPDRGGSDAGAVVLFDSSADTSGTVVESTAPADQLGYAVDASGEWVVAGGNGSGEVQVWRVIGTQRIEQKISLPSGASSSFGSAVSIEGDTFVVGDPNAGTSGRVYVYKLNSSTMQWGLVQSLDINSISGWGTSRIGGWSDANFGGNQWLAVSGNHIAVGAPNEGGASGRVAWYSDNSVGGNWATFNSGYFDEINIASDVPDNDSTQHFGAAIAMTKSVLVIGAPGADVSSGGYAGSGDNDNYGIVRVLQWDEGSTSAPNTVPIDSLFGNPDNGVAGDPAADGYFGAALDIDYYSATPDNAGTYRYTIVVGAPGEGTAGEVYVYQSASASASAFGTATNIYNHATAGDRYGLAVAVSQGRVVVGAPDHTASTENGVFFYERADNAWSGMDLNASAWGSSGTNSGITYRAFTESTYGGSGSDRFGEAVAFSNGNNIAAGAPLYAGDNRGTVAFFYARTPVAVNDSFIIGEDSGAVTFNVKDGTSSTGQNGPDDLYGAETDATVIVTPVLPDSIKGLLVWNADSNSFTYNPNGQFEYLSVGQSEIITLTYRLTTTSGGFSFSTQASVSITINGANDAPVNDAGISNIVVPRVNEPNGNPSGAQTPSTGTVVIPFNAFGDVDQIDILTYSALSITKIGGTGSATVLPSINPATGNIRVSGSYNKVTDTNTGSIVYSMAGLDATYADTTWRVTVQVSDNNGGFTTTTFDFTIGRDNQNPETQTIPAMVATEDSIFVYDFESDDNVNLFGYFRDPDTTSGPYAERLTYTLVSQSGPGSDWLSISASGVLTGAPSNENVGAHTIVLKVTDFFGNSIQSNAFTITVNNTNDAPVLVNEVDRKVSIKGETFSFNVLSGALAWGGGGAPNDDLAPAPYVNPNNFFYDIDNSTVDGRSPSSGDTITYTAFNAVSGTQITGVGTGGTASGANDVSWLAFNGTTFSGTSAGVLGSIVTVRLRATDNHGAYTDTVFEIGIFPRDGTGVESVAMPTPEYAAQLGYDVAINSGTSATATDQGFAGKWAVVGAPGANSGKGYIYIYENTAAANATPTWTLRNSFTTTATYARLGTSVGISADGLRIVAGAPSEDTNGATAGTLQGAVYFFTNNGSGVWSAHTTAKAISPDADNGDRFGSAVAINQNGTVVLVGAPLDDAAGINAGAAYAFNFGAATAGNKLLPVADTTESRAGDLFGSSVAFDQGGLVIGAPRDDHSGKVDAGSAYVYSFAATPTFAMKLKKDATTVANYDYFGTSVDVDAYGTGNNSVVIVVGTPKDDRAAIDAGAVYVYRSTTGYTGITANTSEVVTAYDATALAEFGYSVAVDFDEVGTGSELNALRMAVGSSLNGSSSGAAYALRYLGASINSGWLGQRFNPATDATNPGNFFGYAVDVAASRFLVGAPEAERTGGTASTDLGTLQPLSGKFYGFNSRSVSGTPIEQLSSTSPIEKVADSDQPLPVILSSGSGTSTGANGGSVGSSFFVSLLGDERDEEWERLLRPVTDWSLGAKDVRFMAAANNALASVNSYSDAVLFDQRTEADEKVLDTASSTDQVPPVMLEEAPASEGEKPEASEKAPLAAILRGFSTQLEAANGARARDARQLLASLGSLAS